MPDTDDDQSVELVPDQREQGDDDTEAARERRAAQARAQADRNPTHDLADETRKRLDADDEQARHDDEDLAAESERLELAAKDQQELEELRGREELLDATAETTRAMQLAYVDEQARDVHRQYAANDKQRALGDRAHGRHELDEAAAHPGDAGSSGLAAEGRRFQNLATFEERRSAAEDQIADGYDASAQEHRDDAREPLPNASGAARRPENPAEATQPQDRRYVRGYGQVRDRKNNLLKPDPSTTPDLSTNKPRER